MLNTLIAANASEKLVGALQAYIGPILLLLIGIVAITFLFRREVMQFVLFIIIAVVVAILFYAPGVVKAIAEAFTGETGLKTGGGTGF